MSRYRVVTLGATLILLACAGCGEDKPPRGADALKNACGGILDSATVKEAQESDNFSRAYDVSTSKESHASAAKTLLDDNHAAYVCRIAIDDAPASGDDALWIKFTPGLDSLFPEEENRSFSSYKAYKLGSGIQATTESGSADVYFPCKSQDEDAPLPVTGSLYNDLDLSVEARFRTLFRSSLKMAKALKCNNKIRFPSPEKMRPLPLDES
ncbi:hypothetical protein [Streptomyces sp. NPDC054834]